MLAYDYPLLGLFWSFLFFFLWVAWLIILFRVVIDIFRSDDLNGWMKALWMLFVIVLPYLGVFVYVIARGNGMGQRDLARAQASEQAFREYVQSVAGASGGGVAEEISKMAELRDRGAISEEEFQQHKAKLLARS